MSSSSSSTNQRTGGRVNTSLVAQILLKRMPSHAKEPFEHRSTQISSDQIAPPKTPESPKYEHPQPADEEVDVISQSVDHNMEIWDEAERNRQHYELRAAQTGKPWFLHPKKSRQYAEFVAISPAWAEQMLENLWKHSDGNRLDRKDLVDKYKRDFQAGHWIATDEPISINLAGEVFNGQHRLLAIRESGKTVPMWVCWNVLNEAKLVVDSGQKRNIADRLRLLIDHSLGPRAAGLCKALMRGANGRMRFSESEVAEFATKWQDLIQRINKMLPNQRGEVQAAAAKALLWYGDDAIIPFCDKLRDMQFTEGDGDPVKTLFVSLNKTRITRSQTMYVAYRRTLSAIDAFVHHRQLKRVYEASEDLFDWKEGWEMPERVSVHRL